MVFIRGTPGPVRGLFRSTGAGASRTRINDDAHPVRRIGNGKFAVGRGIVAGRPEKRFFTTGRCSGGR